MSEHTGDDTEDSAGPSGQSSPRTIHDAFFKAVFSDAAQAAEVLRAVLPARLVRRIAWSSLRPAPANFVGAVFRQSYSDLVFQASMRGGGEILVWFCLEHQSSEDRWMPVRVVETQSAMFRQWRLHNPNATYVPAIVTVVVHNGAQPWRADTGMDGLYAMSADLQAELGDYVTRCRFVLDDLAAMDDAELLKRHMNAYALLALYAMARARQERFLELLATEALWLLSRAVATVGAERVGAVLQYIVDVHPTAGRDTLTNLFQSVTDSHVKEVAMTLGQLLRQEGKDQGIKEGIKEGQRSMLLRQLERRFGPLPGEVTARVEAAGSDLLMAWSERVLDASALDQVFAD